MIDRLKKNIENQAFSKLSKKDKQKGLCCHVQFSTIVCFPCFSQAKYFTICHYYDIIQYVELGLLYQLWNSIQHNVDYVIRRRFWRIFYF